MTAHWGIEDPAAIEGSEAERYAAFHEAYRLLRNRISLLLALPIEGLDRLALHGRLEEIGAPREAAHSAAP